MAYSTTCEYPPTPYENLANAIIIVAADDYRNARKKLCKDPDDWKAQATVKEVERFFMSRWYEVLTTVEGRYILNRLKAEDPANPGKSHHYW